MCVEIIEEVIKIFMVFLVADACSLAMVESAGSTVESMARA